MKRLKNQKGIALVTVFILTAIMLGMITSLIYMITVGTQISGIEKRYKTALEAGLGGSEVFLEVISARGNNPFPADISNMLKFTIENQNCFLDKIRKNTQDWNTEICPQPQATSLTIDRDDPKTYDLTITLGTDPSYRVFAKIVDTVEGNSGGDEGLIKGGVVESNPGEVAVTGIPYLYTIEVLAEQADNPLEKARFSILYQY